MRFGYFLGCQHFLILALVLASTAFASVRAAATASTDLVSSFRQEAFPIIDLYCVDCHGGGTTEGGVSLEGFDSAAAIANHDLWWRVLKKTRAGLMPPSDEPQPEDAERAGLMQWIKSQVFRLDPALPDPGAVTLRRLNQVEYRNSIRQLTGVDFDTKLEFPPDDTGEGFDNIGSVLSISPMLLEKYLDAAQVIVSEVIDRESVAGFMARHLDSLNPEPAGSGTTPAIPSDASEREAYVTHFLRSFATQAFRRPVQPRTLSRLTELAETFSRGKDETIETGIAQAMVAVLASPRFLFREENAIPDPSGGPYPLIDEYALAARLSFFLWSSPPDAELYDLAEHGQLRAQIGPQVTRMLQDPRSHQFVENFAGQWLHSRDIENVAINDFDIYLRENPHPEVDAARQLMRDLQTIPEFRRTPEDREAGRAAIEIVTNAFAQPRPKFGNTLRRAMRQETELFFAYLLRENRSALELIDADYSFLNEELAAHYGIDGVIGSEMRQVSLPVSSPRGGVLTQGTILATTSNPTRTSPVKRGVFILETILGTPPAPPPPNIPALEDVASAEDLTHMSLRETLALHASEPLCSSCHNAMDPLGLALENFNAIGRWRDQERETSIDPAGRLITGQSFTNVQELKQIIIRDHRQEFYYCLSEKLLVYALGRSIEYYDTATLDILVASLEATDGQLQTLVLDVIKSSPFQRMRPIADSAVDLASLPARSP